VAVLWLVFTSCIEGKVVTRLLRDNYKLHPSLFHLVLTERDEFCRLSGLTQGCQIAVAPREQKVGVRGWDLQQRNGA